MVELSRIAKNMHGGLRTNNLKHGRNRTNRNADGRIEPTKTYIGGVGTNRNGDGVVVPNAYYGLYYTHYAHSVQESFRSIAMANFTSPVSIHIMDHTKSVVVNCH